MDFLKIKAVLELKQLKKSHLIKFQILSKSLSQ